VALAEGLAALTVVWLLLALGLPGPAADNGDPGAGPVFEGKPLRAWLLQYGQGQITSKDKAHETLERFCRRDEAGAALAALLRDRDPQVRQCAALFLIISGPLGEAELAALVRVLRGDPEAATRRMAAHTLGYLIQYTPAVAAALQDALVKDPDHGVRWKAARSLGRLDPRPAGALPALRKALRDDKDIVRAEAARAVALVADPEEALRDLVPALGDREKRVVEAVTEALGSVGAPALPSLLGTLASKDRVLASRAACAIGRLASGKADEEAVRVGARAAVPAIARMLSEPDVRVRRKAAEALSYMGPEGEAAVPALSAGVSDKDRQVRQNCVMALERMGPKAAPATEVLVAALRDEWFAIRFKAAEALASAGGDPEVVVPALIGALADEQFAVRRLAAQSLGRIGPAARAAVPALQRLLKDPEAQVQREAREALRCIRLDQ
jgi:HEAT repeat protein